MGRAAQSVVIAVGFRALRIAIIAAAVLGVVPRVASAHPLHSTITEVVEDRAHGTVQATIRVFADDYATAVSRFAHVKLTPASGAAWDAASLAYSTAAFGFVDRGGRPLKLTSCGVRRTSDLLWICLQASTADAAGVKVRDTFLCELFDDQVNVVQATLAGARHSLLFTKGDQAKPLA